MNNQFGELKNALNSNKFHISNELFPLRRMKMHFYFQQCQQRQNALAISRQNTLVQLKEV